MTVDDAPGTVTICKRGRTGLYADDLGLTVHNAASRARRFAWAEVSHFADGSGQNEGSHFWILVIVLHAGRKVPVSCTARRPTPETLDAVRQVAERYGIPADVAGVPMKDGQPAERGLYQDPGGRAGVRYWDSRQWSPLLPADLRKPRYVTVRQVYFFSAKYWRMDMAFPGHATIVHQADVECRKAFQAYDGAPLSASEYSFFDVSPLNRVYWDSGARLLLCTAYVRNNQYPRGVPLWGSIKGSYA